MVRCPACKTVFSPAAGLAPPEPQADEEQEEETKPKKRKTRDEDDEEKPRKKRKAKDEEEKPKEENRDFDPIDEEEERRRRKHRRKIVDESMTPQEREARRRAFDRAAWGCKLIWASFAFFILSMILITIFYFQAVLIPPMPVFITFAGVLGLLNWTLGAIGVGLCLSGPRAPGHWGYGIAAATATFVHLIFLLALVSQGKEYSIGQTTDEVREDMNNARWGLLPTRLDITMFYLTAIVYPNEQGATPKGPMALSMVTGVAEMIRIVFIMMMLSCLSRAALDEDLAHKCTRAAGIASFGPGILGLLILAFVGTMIETNATLNLFTMILFLVVNMGVYSILVGVTFPAFMTAREVTDACEEPFQSLIPQL